MYHYFSKITQIITPFLLKVLKSIIFKKNGFRHCRQIPPPRQKKPKKCPKYVQNIFLVFNYD